MRSTLLSDVCTGVTGSLDDRELSVCSGQRHAERLLYCSTADAYALPVEGTETRVNAQSEAYEYIVDFGETSKVADLLSGCSGQSFACTDSSLQEMHGIVLLAAWVCGI